MHKSYIIMWTKIRQTWHTSRYIFAEETLQSSLYHQERFEFVLLNFKCKRTHLILWQCQVSHTLDSIWLCCAQILEICYFFDPERPQQPFSIVSAGSRCKNALAMHTSGVFYFKYIYIQSVSICFVQACTSSTIPFCTADVGGGEDKRN